MTEPIAGTTAGGGDAAHGPAGRPGSTVDLNADLGESFGAWRLGQDEDMLPIVTSANPVRRPVAAWQPSLHDAWDGTALRKI